MSGLAQVDERAIRERAYFIWEREGRPNGRAIDHCVSVRADERERLNELMHEEEKVLADRPRREHARFVDAGRARRVTPEREAGPLSERF